MDLNGIILKFKDSKKSGGLDGARYILTYKRCDVRSEAARASRAVLTALKADGGLVLELNTNLFCNTKEPEDELIYGSIDIAKRLGLEYRYRKIPRSGSNDLLARLLNRPRGDAHELLVHIPPESWDNEAILDLLLPYGARYYITREPSDGGLLDAFGVMTDRDRLERFAIIAFDLGVFGNMGINSAVLKPEEIKNLLGI